MPGWASAAGQPDPDLRRQPHIDRGRYERRLLRGRAIKRYEAYGWHTQRVVFWARTSSLSSGRSSGPGSETDRPSFICAAHHHRLAGADASRTRAPPTGPALGEEEVRRTKEILGYDPDVHFGVDADVLAHARKVVERWVKRRTRNGCTAIRRLGCGQSGARGATPPDVDALASRRLGREHTDLPGRRRTERRIRSRPARRRARSSPRWRDPLPELWGGSADLGGKQPHHNGGRAELHSRRASDQSVDGRTVRTRPALRHSRTRHGCDHERDRAARGYPGPYGAPSWCSATTCVHPVRLAALTGAADDLRLDPRLHRASVGDGPTHQPIEHLAALRAIPGLDVVRPADANETAVCWRVTLEHTDRPTALALSRQNLPVLDPAKVGNAVKGAYILEDASAGLPTVILIATGSEVSLAREAPGAARGRRPADPGRLHAVPGMVRGPAVPPISSSCDRRTSGRG